MSGVASMTVTCESTELCGEVRGTAKTAMRLDRRTVLSVAVAGLASNGCTTWPTVASASTPSSYVIEQQPPPVALAGAKDAVLEDIRDNTEMIRRGSDALKQLEDERLEACRGEKSRDKFDDCFFFGVGAAAKQVPGTRPPSKAKNSVPTW